MHKLKLKKGDNVVVITGRDKGLKGEILRVIPSTQRVLVQGVNTVTKHSKPSLKTKGGIEKIEVPIHISNVAIADPKEGTPTRIGYRSLKDGKKVRFAKKSGEILDKAVKG